MKFDISFRPLSSLVLLFSSSDDFTALMVSLKTENEAVTLAHRFGYVVMLPDTKILDRPLQCYSKMSRISEKKSK